MHTYTQYIYIYIYIYVCIIFYLNYNAYYFSVLLNHNYIKICIYMCDVYIIDQHSNIIFDQIAQSWLVFVSECFGVCW